MKNLNKRTKIIAAIVGVVVLVVVIGLVITQPPASELLGTTALVITPSNPTIVSGNSIGLSVNATYNCAWSSSDTSKVSLVNYNGETKAVTVKGNAAGSATIQAKCGIINVNKVTTTVTVLPALAISPSKPEVQTGNTITLSVPNAYSCNWSSAMPDILSFVSATSGSSVTLKNTATNDALREGQRIGVDVTAQCGNWGSTTTIVSAFHPCSQGSTSPDCKGGFRQ